jgi:hypothetical protein
MRAQRLTSSSSITKFSVLSGGIFPHAAAAVGGLRRAHDAHRAARLHLLQNLLPARNQRLER